MPAGIIQIKLGSCLSMPTRKMNKYLDEIANECNVARNAMARFWLRWREDNPDWKPEQRRDRSGALKFTKPSKNNAKPEPVLEDDALSQEIGNAIYHRGTEAAPRVSATVVSHLRKDVMTVLLADMPYDYKG